ncbi:MAG: transglutaminase domain protein, partial [Frankiales bacterium]|nr:transglutaminase domain protein [Frankiales bacterium]
VDRTGDLDQAAGAGNDGGLSRGALLALLALVGLLVLAALPASLAGLRHRRRWAAPGALAAWAQVRDDAVDVGHAWRPADSPRAAAAHLVAARSLEAPAAASLTRVAAAAEQARYARPGAVADTAELEEDVHIVRGALLAGADRRGALLARFAPASTLLWASHGLGSWLADVLDRFDSTVSAVGERLRHPRRRTAV